MNVTMYYYIRKKEYLQFKNIDTFSAQLDLPPPYGGPPPPHPHPPPVRGGCRHAAAHQCLRLHRPARHPN